MMIWYILSLLSISLLIYIYGGYYFVLKLLLYVSSKLKLNYATYESSEEKLECAKTRGVTVYLSVLNEERNIVDRLDNIYASEFPENNIETIIVSDGSCDNTVNEIKKYKNIHIKRNIRLYYWDDNKGQAAAQNLVAEKSSQSILISTDAETRFSPTCICELVALFSDENVGAVGGIVIYEADSSRVASSYSIYRNYEMKLRQLETSLNIGVQTDGPCVAYLKSVWEPIYEYEDVDQVISMFAKKKGLLTVQADNAICYDRANSSGEKEIQQRRRMTRKGLMSRFGRWRVEDILHHPGFTFALYSHKILRYFSPVILCTLLLSSLIVLHDKKILEEILVFGFMSFVLLVVLKFIGFSLANRLLGVFTAFMISQIAFLLGIMDWLTGDKTGKYKPTNSS